MCNMYIEREVEVYTFSMLLLDYMNRSCLKYRGRILDMIKDAGFFGFPGLVVLRESVFP